MLTYMPNIRGTIAAMTLGVWVLFIPLYVMLPASDLFIFINSLTGVAAISVMWAYWPAMMLTLTLPPSDLRMVDVLTFGLFFSTIAVLGRVIDLTYVRYYWVVIPDGLLSWHLAFFQYLQFTALLMYLGARRVFKGAYKPSWPRVAITAAIGIAVGSFLCLTNEEHKTYPAGAGLRRPDVVETPPH